MLLTPPVRSVWLYVSLEAPSTLTEVGVNRSRGQALFSD